MIVRNEEANLVACLESAQALVDEWVIVDTGSEDGTVDLAKELGARVYEDPWRDDFAHSRNLSLSYATGEWIIWLDGDDRFHGAEDTRAFLEAGPSEDVLYLLVQSTLPPREGGGERFESLWQPRLLRRSAGIRFKYPVHTVPELDGLSLAPAPGRIHHIGYATEEQKRAKAERAFRMMEQLPEDDPHRLYHRLRTLAGQHEFDEVPGLARRLEERGSLPPDVRLMWSQALLKDGKPQEAISVLSAGLKEHPDHPDLFYALLTAAGIGYAGSVLKIHRGGGLFGGVVVTLGEAPAVVRALVGLGALDEAVLETGIMNLGGELVPG